MWPSFQRRNCDNASIDCSGLISSWAGILSLLVNWLWSTLWSSECPVWKLRESNGQIESLGKCCEVFTRYLCDSQMYLVGVNPAGWSHGHRHVIVTATDSFSDWCYHPVWRLTLSNLDRVCPRYRNDLLLRIGGWSGIPFLCDDPLLRWSKVKDLALHGSYDRRTVQQVNAVVGECCWVSSSEPGGTYSRCYPHLTPLTV
jgi:hypothetical protein